MKPILLTHGYFIEEDPLEQKIMKPYPPLGLLSISAYLTVQGIANDVFDSTFYSAQKQLDTFKKGGFKIIGFYVNLMTKVNVIKQIKEIKAIDPDTHVFLGGPDVRYNWKKYLNAGADYIVYGEGELTAEELVKTIQNNESLDKVDGIAYKKDGKLVKNSERALSKKIDELPMPARDQIDMTPYLNAWKDNHGQSMLNVSTQRGCPYTCKWCSTAVYGQSYRRRSPKLVVDELAYLKEAFDVDAFWFVDDVFTVSHKWIKALHAEIKKRQLEFSFECITRAERLTDEVLDLMKDMGCFRIWIGAESGSQKIVDRMDRRVDVNVVRNMIKTTREKGIEAGTFIMLGYPQETYDDIKETIHHLKTSNPDQFTITVAYPIAGTGLYSEIENDIIKQPDWETSTDRDIDFTRTYKRSYYTHAVNRVVNEVNFHKQKLKGKAFSKPGIVYKLKSVLSLWRMRWHAIK